VGMGRSTGSDEGSTRAQTKHKGARDAGRAAYNLQLTVLSDDGGCLSAIVHQSWDDGYAADLRPMMHRLAVAGFIIMRCSAAGAKCDKLHAVDGTAAHRGSRMPRMRFVQGLCTAAE
jgi:hypothetical protein